MNLELQSWKAVVWRHVALSLAAMLIASVAIGVLPVEHPAHATHDLLTGYPSNDCDAAPFTNVVDQPVGSGYVKVRTKTVGNQTWVCMAADGGADDTHLGGKLVVDGSAQALVDDDDEACHIGGVPPAGQHFEGTFGPNETPVHLDWIVAADDPPEVWVCTKVDTVGKRLKVPGGNARFLTDATDPPSGTTTSTTTSTTTTTTTTVPPSTNQPPAVPTLAVPADDWEFAPDSPQTFTLRATDPNGDPYTGTVTIKDAGTNAVVTTFATSPAASEEDSTGTPAPPLAEGEYTWSAKVKDVEGAESDASPERAFTVVGNRAPSVPTLVAPDPDHRMTMTEPQAFVIRSTDLDGDAYTGTVTVRNANTNAVVTTFPVSAAASGKDSTGTPAPPLPEGEYTWSAKVKDVEGAESDASPERRFIVGNRAPVVPTLISPRPGQPLSTTGPQVFTIRATDPDGDPFIGTIMVKTSGGSPVTTFDTAPSPSGESATGAPTVPLSAGTYIWTARAKDASDTGTASAERSFTVSTNQPPDSPVLVAPAHGHVLRVGEPQTFTIAAVDPEGAPYTGTVTVTNTGTGSATSFTTSAAPSGAQSFGTPPVPLSAGDYTWRATATDAFGVTGIPSVSRSFTVSSSPRPVPAAKPAAGPMTRVSVSTTGDQTTSGNSEGPSISDDGRYVAFLSDAPNLVPGDTNGDYDIFVHDRISGVTERVSVSSLATQANGDSDEAPSISADGRYVVFTSSAGNLVSTDTNSAQDVFVHDRVTKQTTRVSVSSSGTQANGDSDGAPSISADGRYVAFTSVAGNLVPGDTNGGWDVFVRDLNSGTTERVSVSSSSVEGNHFFSGIAPSISDDGRYVAFESSASNLVSGDTNSTRDVFVRDRVAGTTTRASVFSGGSQGTVPSFEASISGDGRYVAFEYNSQIHVRDRTAGTTVTGSASSAGTVGNASSFNSSISGNGRYLVFQSSASNLVAGDRNGATDVFLRDLRTGTTSLVSHDPDGFQAYGASSFSAFAPSVSADGLHVAFDSAAGNLVPGDTNGRWDVFAYNRDLSLQCAAGSLSAVGCLSGYGFQAASNKIGLEDFYPYHPFDLGSEAAYLNVANGNLVVQATDLEVPGQGFNFRLTRSYNSRWDQGPGPLGQGWRLGVATGEGDDLLSSVVNAVLSADVGQLLEVVVTEDQFDFFDADGTRHHFIKGGPSGPGWHSPPGVNLTLSDHIVGAERRYRATRPDGATYEFRPVAGSYGLTSVSDRLGNSLTFSYSGGALSTITDSTGRTLSFAWASGYLDSVTFSGSGGSTTVDYTVNSSTGRLTSVTAGGRTVSYAYTLTTDGWISHLHPTDGRGNTSTLSFNQAGMLTGFEDRADKNWAIAYNTPTCQPGDPEAAVATCITDPTGATTTYTSSAEGNLLSRRDAGDPVPNERSYVWAENRLVWEADEAGDTTTYNYNQWGQITQKVEEGGGDPAIMTVLDYRDISPGVADLVSVRVGAGSADERVWHFGRDDAGNLISTTDPLGAVTTHEYYVRGLLKTVTDPRAKTTTYGNTAASDGGYHGSGNPTSVTDPLGETTTITYNFRGRPTTIVDRNGNTWSFAYDARGNLTSQSTPEAGSAVTYSYDANDSQISATPPGGATTSMVYDARGNLTESSATIGGTLRKATFHYADDGELIELRGPRTYAGSPTVTQTVTIERHPNNRLKAVVDEEGSRTEVTYTPDGLLRTVLEPPGAAGQHLTTYSYNRRGQATSILESGHSNPTTHTYNVLGERTSTKTPKGRTVTFEYDKAGRLVTATDANGNATTRVYDPAGNLVRITQPTGQGDEATTSYSYTARGEIATESDPADGAHEIAYAFDAEGRQRFRYDRYNGATERTFEQVFRSDGAVTSRTATGTGLPTHSSTFTVNAAGLPTAATATLGGATVSSVSISYNGAFEPTSVTETLSGVTKTVSYAYQPDGLLASRTVDGNTTTYAYTKSGLETTTTPWGSMGSFTNQYFQNGALKKTTFPNGAAADHLYDSADRLTSRAVTHSDGLTPLSTWTGIAYDEDDLRTAETVAQHQTDGSTVPLQTGKAAYAYDAVGRLVSAKHPFEVGTATFELDDAGNVISETGPTTSAGYSYADNRLTRRSARTSETTKEQVQDGTKTTTSESSENSLYSYDHLGDLSREQTTVTANVYTTVEDSSGNPTQPTTNLIINAANITTTGYDAASHTKRVTESDGSYVDYAYDALGRLARRIEHWPGESDVTTLFFHDGVSDQIALETNGSGTVETRYALDSAGRPLGDDEIQDNLGRAYYVTDPRGNLTQLVGHDQDVKMVLAYDSFGKEKGALTDTVENRDSRLRFQVAPVDPKTGAYALGPRLYDPSTNRFAGADFYTSAGANLALQVDPLTGNRYLYAGANPANLVDDGHSPRRSSNRRRYFAPTSWDFAFITDWDIDEHFVAHHLNVGGTVEGIYHNYSTININLVYYEVWLTGEFRSRPCDSCWEQAYSGFRTDLNIRASEDLYYAKKFVMNSFAGFIERDQRPWSIPWRKILSKALSCVVSGWTFAEAGSAAGPGGAIAGAAFGCGVGIVLDETAPYSSDPYAPMYYRR